MAGRERRAEAAEAGAAPALVSAREAGAGDGPPGRVGSRRAYTGRVISLDVDTVRFPDGSVGELEMVRHPGASAVVPLLSPREAADPTVLLIRQYRYAAEGYLYEVPAGRLDRGEHPDDCARRELAEETGYTAERVERLFTMYTTPGFTDERIHLYLATGLTPGEASREADEFVELVPTPLSRALAMIEGGEIQDAKTALALFYAAQFRLSRP
jgi:ADP-ribose pyrophosphatase